MNIFVCIRLTSEQTSRLQKALPEQNLLFHPALESDPAARDAIDSCQIVFGNPLASWIADSPVLSWVQLESVGYGEYTDLDWLKLSTRVQMTNLAGFFSEPVAESILAGILSHYRGMSCLSNLQANRKWLGDELRPLLKTLHGAQIVLFGKGDINRRVAELLEPFRCAIQSFGRNWQRPELQNALSKADIVICTVPDSPSTRGVFDRNLIGSIKVGSLFVNFGRGSLIDEAALAEALESNHLSGAVIDVTKDAPLPPDHRFWACPNLLLTQHTGGGTADEIDRKIDFFLANFDRRQRKEPLHRSVDFMKGK
jgi:phosphoglycerate dehydrogenase-like enzyme